MTYNFQPVDILALLEALRHIPILDERRYRVDVVIKSAITKEFKNVRVRN